MNKIIEIKCQLLHDQFDVNILCKVNCHVN